MDHARSVSRTFAWRSGVVFAAVGILAHLLIQDVVGDHFRGSLDFHADFLAHTIVEPLVRDLGGPDGASTDDADALADAVAFDTQVRSVDVVDAEGTVLLADDPARLGGPTAPVDRPDSHQTRVTVEGLGQAEAIVVAQDRTLTDAAASDLTRRFDMLLLGGLATMWMLLLPLAGRLGSGLEERTHQLEAQRAELERLLAGEQETRRRVEELARMKDAFLSAVSHELRTPLTVVTGMLMTLQRHGEALPAERQRDMLARAERSAHKLEELLKGLLELNRHDQDPGPARRERVELLSVVNEARAHLPPHALELDLQVPDVMANPVQLERVVANLVGNAVRHAPGSPIHITSMAVDDAVELQVADRGPGVPDELKQAIYEPFRQGALNDSHAPGTGIGLSLVRRFVSAHEGCTWISDRPGGGAVFHVRLPARAGRNGDGDPMVSGGDLDRPRHALPSGRPGVE